MAGKHWEAYKIIEVRKLYCHCSVTQSVQGKPWRVFTNDVHLPDTAKLLSAIQMGTTIEENFKVCNALGSPTKEKKTELQQKQEAKKETRQQRTHFEELHENVPNYICCVIRMCMTLYKCSFTTRSNIGIIQFLEISLDLSRETQRIFIANRLKSKNIGLNTSEYYLENIDTMNYYITQGGESCLAFQ